MRTKAHNKSDTKRHERTHAPHMYTRATTHIPLFADRAARLHLASGFDEQTHALQQRFEVIQRAHNVLLIGRRQQLAQNGKHTRADLHREQLLFEQKQIQHVD